MAAGGAWLSIVLIGLKMVASSGRSLLSAIIGIAVGMMNDLVAVKLWQFTLMPMVNVWGSNNESKKVL